MKRALLAWLVPLTLVLASSPVVAEVSYVLETPSNRDYGCHDPCACPDIQLPVHGTFNLTRLAPDPLFEHYALTEIDWGVDVYGVDDHFTGSGEYMVGGEFAMQHRLILDLERDGMPQHYDSGLVLGGGEFPKIAITAAAETVGCFHDVFDLVTEPTSAAGVGGAIVAGALRVSPNPFRSVLGISFSLEAAASVSARVFDTAGRAVRSVLSETRLGAGPHELGWDGRRDDGTPVGAGIYLVRVEVGTRARWSVVARIQ